MSPPRTLAKLFAASALFCAFSGAAASTALAECYDYEVVVVRGTEEHNLGPGSMAFDGPSPQGGNDINHPQGVWTLIRKELQTPTDGSKPKTVVRYDLPYRASVADLNRSADEGLRMLVGHLNTIAVNCPAQRTILLGYSQGAVVVGNAISTPSKRILRWFDDINWPVYLSTAATNAIVGVGLLSDTGFRGSETTPNGTTPVSPDNYNTAVYGSNPFVTTDWRNGALEDLNRRMNDGTYRGTGSGYAQRAVGALTQFHKDKVRSFCLYMDPVCESGSNQLMAHLAYQGDFAMKRKTAMFQLGKIRQFVDKSYAATCSVSSSNTGATGSFTGAKITVRGYIPDVVHNIDTVPRQVKFSNVTASIAFEGAALVGLRSSLLNPPTADAAATTWMINATNATPNTQSLVPTGAITDTTPWVNGQPWVFDLPSNPRSLNFIGNAGSRVDLRAAQLAVTFTSSVEVSPGQKAITRLYCTSPDPAKSALSSSYID